jgi:hypothetical protein
MISAQQRQTGPLQPACKNKKCGEGLGRHSHRPHGLLSTRRTEARPAPARVITQNAFSESRLAEAVWRNPAAAAPLVIGARVMWERA